MQRAASELGAVDAVIGLVPLQSPGALARFTAAPRGAEPPRVLDIAVDGRPRTTVAGAELRAGTQFLSAGTEAKSLGVLGLHFSGTRGPWTVADGVEILEKRLQSEEEQRERNRSVRVLAVDDDPTTLRLLTRHLKNAGYDVLTAENGQEALEIALHETPHVIVTDWMMPGMSGVDLCRALRRFEPGRNVYILILTGREDTEQIVEGFKVYSRGASCSPARATGSRTTPTTAGPWPR